MTTAAPIRREALKVFVRGLRIDARIGVYDHERGRRQPLVVEVELTLGEQPIARLSDTVNYEIVVERARANADVGHVELVEEYVERLARDCLEDPRVRRVRVRAEKPEAIAGAEAAGCEVVLTRE
ncbi:MAG TPA: dihydroneopterin aldolase [Caulobacteraceae bacterium]|nr:dihydroneopterin aldolase [Caulobacteraceae bacterium]